MSNDGFDFGFQYFFFWASCGFQYWPLVSNLVESKSLFYIYIYILYIYPSRLESRVKKFVQVKVQVKSIAAWKTLYTSDWLENTAV